ncbi:MAG: DNA-binding response regulator, LuxR family protein [Myxococcales bacterium]|nr:DNA-binding response regulator, LuxR family protein [Myxococcales bacterium]
MIRVFIADDHAIVRHGLRELISSTTDMKVVGEATDGRQLLNAAPTLECDVVILDLSLPKVNGPEVLRRIKQERPSLNILVLTMYPEDQYAVALLRSGASAYLCKDRPSTELLEAIRRVAAGGTYFTETIAQRFLTGPNDKDAPPHAALTAREHQVFTLVIQGRTGAEIAAELDLTAGTVSNHVAKIKEKLGAHSLAEIVRYAYRAGLID